MEPDGWASQYALIGPKNYIDMASDARFWNAVWNTFYFTALAMALELLLGVAIALFLDAKDYRGKRLVTSILLLPMMATPVAVAMVWLLMFEPTAGVINYVLGEIGLPKPLWIAGSAASSLHRPGGHLGVDAADHADRAGGADRAAQRAL